MWARGVFRIAPDPSAGVASRDPKAPEVDAILIAAGPNEFYFGSVGGALRVAFAPTTPGPRIVGLGDVQQGKFVDGPGAWSGNWAAMTPVRARFWRCARTRLCA